MLRTAALVIALAVWGAVIAGDAPRLVLKGHDPVAYFTEGKPVQGSPQFAHDWDGGRYYFTSARNRDTFAGDPDRYAPRFGGYCMGSMSRGKFNAGDPRAWIISDGKLYVFGNVKFKHIAEKDPAFVPARIPAAEANWRARK